MSVARHDRLQNLIPAICAVDVAGTKRAPFEVAELVEQEQRMVAGAGSNALISTLGCSAVLIDYGDVGDGPASLDPVTLEL
jgi:hypothetical protein